MHVSYNKVTFTVMIVCDYVPFPKLQSLLTLFIVIVCLPHIKLFHQQITQK